MQRSVVGVDAKEESICSLKQASDQSTRIKRALRGLEEESSQVVGGRRRQRSQYRNNKSSQTVNQIHVGTVLRFDFAITNRARWRVHFAISACIPDKGQRLSTVHFAIAVGGRRGQRLITSFIERGP